MDEPDLDDLFGGDDDAAAPGLALGSTGFAADRPHAALLRATLTLIEPNWPLSAAEIREGDSEAVPSSGASAAAQALDTALEAVKEGDWPSCANAARLSSAHAWGMFVEHSSWHRQCERELFIFSEVLLALCGDALGDAIEAIRHVDRVFVFVSAGPVREILLMYVRLLDEEAQAARRAGGDGGSLPCFPAVPRWAPRLPASDLGVQEVPRLLPAEAEAHAELFKTGRPFVVSGLLEGWPAFERWQSLGYLDRVVGHRLVPLEVGSAVGAADWREEMMLVGDFLRQHLAPSCEYCSGDVDSDEAPASVFEAGVAYLAQHELLAQCPTLHADVQVPLPWIKNLGAPARVNAWLGTHGTVTPCHWDSYDNCLAQVQGTKQVILLAPEMAPYLYVNKGSGKSTSAQGNIAQVNVEAPDFQAFPEFAKAERHVAEIGPGDALFIPVKWWHQVRSFSPSFSVNFWF